MISYSFGILKQIVAYAWLLGAPLPNEAGTSKSLWMRCAENYRPAPCQPVVALSYGLGFGFRVQGSGFRVQGSGFRLPEVASGFWGSEGGGAFRGVCSPRFPNTPHCTL